MMTNPEERITLDIVARHARCSADALAPTQLLIDLGIDSLKFIVLILEIEHGLDRKVFDVANVGQMRTVDDLLGLVRASVVA